MESTEYHDYVYPIDVSRHPDTITIVHEERILQYPELSEFTIDMYSSNDSIELNLVKNNVYQEAAIFTLTRSLSRNETLYNLVLEQQKTFGGSKLFYINETKTKLLILAVKGSMEGKISMVIARLNRVNEKVHRINAKFKKENLELSMKKSLHPSEKDSVIGLLNKSLKA